MAIPNDIEQRVADVDSDSVPSRNQWLSPSRRTLTPKRVLTYDCNKKTVEVRKMKSFEGNQSNSGAVLF